MKDKTQATQQPLESPHTPKGSCQVEACVSCVHPSCSSAALHTLWERLWGARVQCEGPRCCLLELIRGVHKESRCCQDPKQVALREGPSFSWVAGQGLVMC